MYFSRKGENYWNGSIKDLQKGNTERVAEFIQKAVGGGTLHGFKPLNAQDVEAIFRMCL